MTLEQTLINLENEKQNLKQELDAGLIDHAEYFTLRNELRMTINKLNQKIKEVR